MDPFQTERIQTAIDHAKQFVEDTYADYIASPPLIVAYKDEKQMIHGACRTSGDINEISDILKEFFTLLLLDFDELFLALNTALRFDNNNELGNALIIIHSTPKEDRSLIFPYVEDDVNRKLYWIGIDGDVFRNNSAVPILTNIVRNTWAIPRQHDIQAICSVLRAKGHYIHIDNSL